MLGSLSENCIDHSSLRICPVAQFRPCNIYFTPEIHLGRKISKHEEKKKNIFQTHLRSSSIRLCSICKSWFIEIFPMSRVIAQKYNQDFTITFLRQRSQPGLRNTGWCTLSNCPELLVMLSFPPEENQASAPSWQSVG